MTRETREIKFRAWNWIRGEFVFFTLVHGGVRYELAEPHAAFEGDLKPWQQKTPFFDKSGKEIYEGDILGDEKTALEVYASDHGYLLRSVNGGETSSLPVWALRSDANYIIGSIYSTPELITDKSMV